MEGAGRLALFAEDRYRLIIGRAGWAYVLSSELEDAQVWLRLERTDTGRYVVSSLHIEGAVDGPLLRSLPLSRLEAAANGPGLDRSIQWRIEEGSPVGPGLWPDPAERDHLLESFLMTERAPRLKFHVPAEGVSKKPDEFYVRVAKAYSWLAGRTSRPAAELAERNDVPLSTVHRWVKEARRRGLLGPGRPGRAG
jgi:hypothetical protein